MATDITSIERPQSYFSRASVQWIVFGAFVFLTMPLALGVVFTDAPVMRWVPLYGVTFGLTHFLTTGFIYLDSANLRYFASSLRNKLIYFVVPVAIFVVMDLATALGARARMPWLDEALLQIVFLANLFLVSRQSFGVLQLFKSATAGLYSEGLRSVENLFFVGLALLQAETFWSGMQYDPNSLGVRLTTFMVAGMFVLVATLHWRVFREGARSRQDWVPILYFVFQSVAGALAVWKTSLYGIALAMHYVEYHVVMMPRVFESPVDKRKRADRMRRWITRSAWGFYAGLLAIAWAVWLTQRTQLYLDPFAAPLGVRIVLHSLDGLFLAHFFVEAFVWRLSTPHYRKTLGPLYFAPKVGKEGGEATSGV